MTGTTVAIEALQERDARHDSTLNASDVDAGDLEQVATLAQTLPQATAAGAFGNPELVEQALGDDAAEAATGWPVGGRSPAPQPL